MSFRTRFSILALALTFIPLFTLIQPIQAQGVTLYTPYTKIIVPPGKKLKYTLDIINKTGQKKDIKLRITGIPASWSYKLEAGGYELQQISVLPGETKRAALNVEIPYQADQGSYSFAVVATGLTRLPLAVTVNRESAYKTEFTCNQKNMEGAANSTFNFNANLKNGTGETQRYALRSLAPRGWTVIFKPSSKQATSVELKPDEVSYITISVKPPRMTKAGTYKIPVRAETTSSSADLTLEVVITGSYGLELTTPTGLLSAKATAGTGKRISLILRNTGSSALKDIRLRSAAPMNWEVNFEPESVLELAAGESKEVTVVVRADKKAIAGDYMATFTARTPEVSAQASFRITVRTPMITGWIGILIIILSAGVLYYLFRKYGRR